MKTLHSWLLCLVVGSAAWGQGGVTSNARIANPCELVGINGRIYTIYEYYRSFYSNMELCAEGLPVVSRPFPTFPLPEPRVASYLIFDCGEAKPCSFAEIGGDTSPSPAIDIHITGDSYSYAPEYVPAIQVKDGGSYVGMCMPHETSDAGMNGLCLVPRQTCADPKRVLEHDEQSPPTYWCRKVIP